MSPSDFITQRQAAFGEFLDSSFLADVHICPAADADNSRSVVRLHSAVLAAASGFWRETLSDVNVQGELFLGAGITDAMATEDMSVAKYSMTAIDSNQILGEPSMSFQI